MEECRLNIGGHELIIERFGKNDYSVYYVEWDQSVRGTLPEILAEICDNFGNCINDIRF